MYRSERWPEESPEPRSRAGSRRSSGSQSRRGSIKQEREAKPLSSAPASASATPKKTAKPQNLDFVVTGKQIIKRSDRANSLPGAYRRPSGEGAARGRRAGDSPRRAPHAPPARACASHETSLEDDMSLDLSQVSDFEDTNSKYGAGHKLGPATSTPLPGPGRGKPRSASLQSQPPRACARRTPHSLDSCSRDSFRTSTSSGSPYRAGAELDYSSVSPEYSGQSSAELTPTRTSQRAASPASRDLQLSSCCVSTWAECSEVGAGAGAGAGVRGRGGCAGEWCSFWANYNSSLGGAGAGVGRYYDQCPTPYRTDTFDLADFEFTEGSRKRSPDNVEVINNIIRHQGLQLTPRETQSIIKCAHLLGNVLATAIDRRSSADPPLGPKKNTMTLDLKETSIPLEVKEEKTCESATTQTDISLPNTKSAPRIFENILRQLSRSSIDVDKIENKDKNEVRVEAKSDAADVSDARGDAGDARGDVSSEVSGEKKEV